MSLSPVSNPAESAPRVSVVIIGRNEGERLVACLESLQAVTPGVGPLEVIYVDSASTDGSPARAAALGARVIRVQPERPSAALGRNAGWRAARGEFVLFLDGDTVLHPDFLARALAAFEPPDIAIVWGHRRESRPQQSVYVRVLDLDWVYPPGETEFCGGDALMRRSVLAAVDGFDPTLIAGEEPEMCRRIRALGQRILHLDVPMTRHDLAIHRFPAYWRRAFRAGHAYAEVSERFRDSADPLWRREVERNRLHAMALLGGGAGFVGLLAHGRPSSLALAGGLFALGAALIVRSALRNGWKTDDPVTRLLYAVHSHFQQIPIFFGQLAQRRDARRGRQRALIEYKDAASPPRPS